jgi:pSer/pThr/pTyr-binding forkhead associated (FHA) protein
MLSPARVIMELPSLTRAAIAPGRDALIDALTSPAFEQGYVHGCVGGADYFLFVRDGRAWGAGRIEEDSPEQISVAEFLARSLAFESAALCRTDLPLFLCSAVLFRKAPAAHVPAALIDAHTVVSSVASLGKDAVLAVHTRAACALAFCRGGEPVSLYAAHSLRVPADGTVTDRVLELVYAMKEQSTISLYDEIRLPPAADAGQAIAELRDGVPLAAKRPTLLVSLGDRLVFRHRLDREETIVGRSAEAQLALDNLSVSRRHALVRLNGARVVVEDLESENGILSRGERVPRAELGPGDAVQVGKYTLTYALAHDSVERSDPRRVVQASDIDTVKLSTKGAVVEHDGKKHKVSSAVFTIGNSAEASLRIRGAFVADVAAVIQIDGDGYRVERVGRWRRVRVNGVVTDRQRLREGDEIVVAGERVVFHERP